MHVRLPLLNNNNKTKFACTFPTQPKNLLMMRYMSIFPGFAGAAAVIDVEQRLI